MGRIITDGDRVLVEGQTFRIIDTAWEDLRIVPSAFDFAGNSDPVQTTWRPAGAGATFRVWEFAVNDEAFFTCQVPHSYKEGTPLRPHVHWTPKDRGTAEAGKIVAWALDYSAISVGGIFLASKTIAMNGICSGVNDKHEITTGGGTISDTGLGISSMLIGRLYRNSDTWQSSTTGQLPILLEFDLHFEVDSFGSDQELVK